MIFNNSNDIMMTSFITKKELEVSAILNPPDFEDCKFSPFYLKLW